MGAGGHCAWPRPLRRSLQTSQHAIDDGRILKHSLHQNSGLLNPLASRLHLHLHKEWTCAGPSGLNAIWQLLICICRNVIGCCACVAPLQDEYSLDIVPFCKVHCYSRQPGFLTDFRILSHAYSAGLCFWQLARYALTQGCIALACHGLQGSICTSEGQI